jgi:hypothetical protein
MMLSQHRREFILIAAIAIGIVLLLLLVPHAHPGDNGAWLAVLPLLFVGLISPLSLLSMLALLCLGITPGAPVLPASFPRPPPIA